MLDVGIGTGSALARNRAILRSKNLRISGIDIDSDYVLRAHKCILDAGLGDTVDVRLESVYDHSGGPYDAVYFSASFMILSEPERALHQVSTLLSPGGRIFFTQTFSERRSALLEKAKPLLKNFTTVEFGRVTYEDDFVDTLRAGGFQLEELTVMNRNPIHSYRLAVASRADPHAP